jgi:hypothetical protein
MFTPSAFKQLMLIAIQEGLLGTVVIMAVYLVVRGVFRGLEKMSASTKRRTTQELQPAATTTPVCTPAEKQEVGV